jgi:hypothetical protein
LDLKSLTAERNESYCIDDGPAAKIRINIGDLAMYFDLNFCEIEVIEGVQYLRQCDLIV